MVFEPELYTPSISVVLPVKNGGGYIAPAIESILKQTFHNFELLVVDDGSTDATLDILVAFQLSDDRVRVLINPGSGLVDALNHGLISARAPLIARMDADDIALPQRLRVQYDFMKAHPDIDVVGSQQRFIDEQGVSDGRVTELPQSPEHIDKALLKYCCLRHPTVMMRRAAVERVGGYRPQLVAAEDFDLWLRLAENGKLANLPDVLLLYRVHKKQVSQEKMWTQRISRNLALISAHERRAGRADPIGSETCDMNDHTQHVYKGQGCSCQLCETFRVFRAAEALSCGRAGEVAWDDARLLVRYVSKHSIGDGKSNALRVLLALCHEALRRRAPVTLARAFTRALRIHPGRTIRFMATSALQ